MKLKKKGMVWSVVIKWMIGIFVVLILIYILVGPEKLFDKAKDMAFYFGIGLLQEEKAPDFLTKSIPKNLEIFFDNMVTKIKTTQFGEFCLVDIGQKPKAKGFSIGLYEDNIQIEKQEERGLTPSYKKEVIEGFKPCFVKDKEAGLFYDCLKKGLKCKNAYQENPTIIRDDVNIAPFLFKFDNEHLCIIYLDGFDFGVGCSKREGLLDNACVDDIRKTYPNCKENI